MAQDPLEAVAVDGRISIRPIAHFGLPKVITVDLEALHGILYLKFQELYSPDQRIRSRYPGSNAEIVRTLNADLTALADYAAACCYNKLRAVLEAYAPHERTVRMNTRAPMPNNIEFPTFISSTLGSIGPCRFEDAAKDVYVVWATSATTANNYGRTNPTVFNYPCYARICNILKEIGVQFAPFPNATAAGSYFATLEPHVGAELCTAYCTVHSSHYENEDFARIALLTGLAGNTPFQPIGMRIGYVNDTTTLTALAAVAAPAGIPAGQDAGSAGIPVQACFNVNYYGIQPAVAAAGERPASDRGMYVLGRGTDRYYQCTLAHQVSLSEVTQILRYRLFRGAPPAV